MINGAHVLMMSNDAEADRNFLRDVLGLKCVDVGHGWLIFGLPPAEVAVHPAEDEKRERGAGGYQMLGAHLYLMCDDLRAEMARLKAKNVEFGKVSEERWGGVTTLRLPSGGEIGLYQPKHPVAYGLGGPKA
jgi:catechol 2,3-dioxygenase-like lactoylglutathione lyase family enzyme